MVLRQCLSFAHTPGQRCDMEHAMVSDLRIQLQHENGCVLWCNQSPHDNTKSVTVVDFLTSQVSLVLTLVRHKLLWLPCPPGLSGGQGGHKSARPTRVKTRRTLQP